MRLGHKPCCGLLDSLELEFTIVSDEHAPVITPVATRGADEHLIDNTYTDKYGYYFTTGDTSTEWELNNAIIRGECITLDNTVNNNIVKHLLEGQSLKNNISYVPLCQ